VLAGDEVIDGPCNISSWHFSWGGARLFLWRPGLRTQQ